MGAARFLSHLLPLVRQAEPAVLALLCGVFVAGCIQRHALVEKNLMTQRQHELMQQEVDERYNVGCPDVLDILVTGRVHLHLTQPVAVDGRIDLGKYGRPRVEGRNPEQIAALVAEEIGVSPRDVHIEVAEYRSQQVYLFGQVVGWQRAVPYQGQETVLDLLQRVGGITRGAEPGDVYVVRPHVMDGQRPEAFHVDLKAIVLRDDQATNLRLLPNDQIYVGETLRHRVERAVPPLLRPVYRTLSNTNLDKEERQNALRRSSTPRTSQDSK